MIEILAIITAFIVVGALIMFLFKNIILIPHQDKQITECIEEKRYADAEFLVRQYLNSDPKNIRLKMLLAEILWVSNNKNDSITIYDNFYEHNFNKLELSHRKKILYRLSFWAYQFKNYDMALRYAEEAIDLDPTNADVLFLTGSILLDQKNTYQAVDLMYKAIQSAPKNTTFLTKLANTLLEIENYNEAFTLLHKLVKLEPLNAEHWFNLGFASEKINEIGKALKFYSHVETLQNHKLTILSQYRMGKILYSNNPKESLLIWEKAKLRIKEKAIPIESIGKDIVLELYYDLGELYSKQDQYSLSTTMWKMILEIDPKYRDVQKKFANIASSQINDFFKDVLTLKDARLLESLFEFVTVLGFSVDSYKIITPEYIEIVVFEASAKWRDVRKRKILFSFWCSDSPFSSELTTHIITQMKNLVTSKVFIISAGPILSETRAALEFKSVDFYDRSNIQELLDASKTTSA